MKFTKNLYEGATLYGDDMYVKDIDVSSDATEFSFSARTLRGIKYYYLREIKKSFPNVRKSILTKTSAEFR